MTFCPGCLDPATLTGTFWYKHQFHSHLCLITCSREKQASFPPLPGLHLSPAPILFPEISLELAMFTWPHQVNLFKMLHPRALNLSRPWAFLSFQAFSRRRHISISILSTRMVQGPGADLSLLWASPAWPWGLQTGVVFGDQMESVNWRLALCHPPLHGLNREPQQQLTLSTPWKELRVEIRNEARCAPGKLAEQVFR